MQQMKAPHICTGCGKIAKRNPNKRQWCKCNPSTPFKMMVKYDYDLAHKMVNSLIAGTRSKKASEK